MKRGNGRTAFLECICHGGGVNRRNQERLEGWTNMPKGVSPAGAGTERELVTGEGTTALARLGPF